MPPMGSKGKGKARDARGSRSRNTTPSSVLSAPTSSTVPAYLDSDATKQHPAPEIQYAEVYERLSSSTPAPDPRYLEKLVDQLRALGKYADERVTVCDTALRELVSRRQAVVHEQREQQQREREAEERRARLKKEAEDEEDGVRVAKANKVKKRKPDRNNAHDDQDSRPLTHGAHGLARQDGLEIKQEGNVILPTSYVPLLTTMPQRMSSDVELGLLIYHVL